MGLTWVITGTSRGIGAEFVKQLKNKGDTVIACARNPDSSDALKALVDGKQVHAVKMDITDVASVKAATDKISELAPEGIDVLVNNSGVGTPQTEPLTIQPEAYTNDFNTNVVGTSIVIQALVPLLRKRDTRRIINISSIMGSMECSTESFNPSYRVSKAAVNMLTRVFAAQLKDEGFVIVCVHPGWVQTDMGTHRAPLTTDQSIGGMLSAFDKLTKASNGTFFDYKGETLPW
ncbi:c-signal [Lichtheimia corymbifera JMRC:FSU:9682]|uniref:C-signal n=1 Tax=Lichtheimia corymbifera JMRC:FSU:9682 TaxID=1263082 RepID=A0A068S3A5_9FUNG|nr:c-signal [Lichtheimia corymbifera JMRC:FSU:9682]